MFPIHDRNPMEMVDSLVRDVCYWIYILMGGIKQWSCSCIRGHPIL